MEKYNTEEILRESQDNVKKLNEKLKDIENLHNEIKESINLSLKNPKIFKELAENLNGSAELYLKGNNTIFEEKIVEISTKTAELSSEISRLVEVDFNAAFKELERQFLENSKEEIGKELKKFEDKAKGLQNKIDEFGKEIIRLSKIDLETHFDKHQNKLSEVFISVNGINGILSNISQNINKTIQNLGDIDQTLSKHHKENNAGFALIFKNQDSNKKQLLDNSATNQKELLLKLKDSDLKINSIISQNKLLKKEIDINKKLSFGMIALLVVAIVILLIILK
jgi:uncharacterized protein YukE